ncbi:putative phospholipase D [Helianthus annuus]|nr:putative phospholipase D [Helianthus annuus]
MHWKYQTISRGHNSILHNLNALLGPKTEDYISFYGLWMYGRLGDDGPIVKSQIGVLIEDREFTESTMNGECWSAEKFANSLRLSLWSEHLGLHDEEVSAILPT